MISSATNKLLTDDMSVLKFDYYPEIKSENKSYIYRDVHWGYALTMYDRFHDELAYSGFGPITRRALEKLANKEKEIYEHTSCIFTMGKWFAHEVAKDYDLPPNKVVHVGGGINLDKSLIDTSLKQRNKILFVGRDFERKNGPLVVEAFKIAKKCNPELELYIVGPQYLNINYEGIYNLGKLSHKDVAYYFNLCDVFCMPSRHEMYGFVFPEALAFGLPCIVRNAYEMPYFIQDGENGYVMENDSAQNLATVMLKAVDNDRMKKYVMKNREYYLKEYSWNTVAKRMYDVIE